MKKNKLSLTTLIVLLFGIFAISAKSQNCKYDKNGFKEVPWGHIQSQVIVGKIRAIKRNVYVGNKEVLPGVKIALYRINDKNRVFIGSQISDEKGNFCFKDLPKGKYELRMGLEGLNSRYFLIDLVPNNKSLKNKFDAILEVGT